MFDTNIVIVGNVLNAPEWRRVSGNNALVANFRVASTARRYDKETGRWVDGNSLRVRVTAWRKLAEGVASSITVGDPVIVYGRFFSRDCVDDDRNHRVAYEMEAFSIGHDLGRGRGRFYRNKALPASTVEGPDADAIVRGEPSVALDDSEAPVTYGDGLPLDEDAPEFLEVVTGPDDAEATAAAEPVPAPPAGESRRARRGTRREPVAA